MTPEEIIQIQQEALRAIKSAGTEAEISTLEQQFLGRKSQLALLSQNFGQFRAEQRAEYGKLLNATKQVLIEAVALKKASLSPAASTIDLSLPASTSPSGHLHLTTQTTEEIIRIFSHLGMSFVEAPEADYDWYAFESLNMGKDHPARDDWETFFVDLPDHPTNGKVVLRPHTTNFELHVMEEQQPPIRVITVGKTYRRQSDASHLPMFHQFEGLVVDKGLSLGDLIGTLEFFIHAYFGPEVRTRLRPYHFRFTEPSFEIDLSCSVCEGAGCKLCKEGWLELGGAGMTHPSVLRNGGLDPQAYSGFAWGWGVERCFMIRHGIGDIRQVYDNDLRFLEQF